MSFVSVSVVDLIQSESNYYNEENDSGNFVFKLSEPVGERWKEMFSDVASKHHGDFYYYRTPTIKDDIKVSAVCQIDGDQDIPYTLELIKKIISETNGMYNQEVKVQLEDKEKESKRRDSLDTKVKEIIGKLSFK